jgi:hypothetical protein
MIVLILSGSILIPLWRTKNPKNLPDDIMNAYFNGFSLSACSLSWLNTTSRYWRCSLYDMALMIRSST